VESEGVGDDGGGDLQDELAQGGDAGGAQGQPEIAELGGHGPVFGGLAGVAAGEQPGAGVIGGDMVVAAGGELVCTLIAAIEAYLQANNNDPKPFVWAATAEEILEKVSRGGFELAATPVKNETPH
jgi:hypothetical protein